MKFDATLFAGLVIGFTAGTVVTGLLYLYYGCQAC
jgi:hypothetical protein